MRNHPDINFTQATINQLNKLRECRQQLTDTINDLSARRVQLEQQESALNHFLVAAGELPSNDANGDWSPARKNDHDASNRKGWMRHKQDPELADLVYDILDKLHGEEMHYKEIVQEVAATDWPFTDNQRSREAWVNRVLNGDGRFIRPSKRGYYSLKKYYPEITRSVGERQRKKP